MRGDGITKKRGIWYLRRRVPEQFHEVESRRMINLSLRTDSRRVATVKAAAAWEDLLSGWQAAMDGDKAAAEHLYQSARRAARRHGVRYVPADEVAALPLADLLERLEIVESNGPTVATLFLG